MDLEKSLKNNRPVYEAIQSWILYISYC